MVVYLIFILSILILTNLLLNKETTKIGYFFSSFLVFIFAAIRFDIGFDYDVYYRIIDGPILAGLEKFEPLSLILILPAINFRNPYIFFIISSFIIYWLASYAFKKNSTIPALSLIIYIGLFYLTSLSIVRQAIALSVCLYAYKYITRKSFIKYCILILISTLFHYSAAISVIIYFIYHYTNIKLIFITLIATCILSPFVFSLMISTGMYTAYLEDTDLVTSGKLTRFVYLVIFISYFTFLKRSLFTSEEKKMLSILMVGTFIPFFLGGIGERVSYYFLIYHCYAIPLFLKGQKKYKRKLYALVFSAYFLTMIGYTSILYDKESPYIPYRTIFHNSNIEFR